MKPTVIETIANNSFQWAAAGLLSQIVVVSGQSSEHQPLMVSQLPHKYKHEDEIGTLPIIRETNEPTSISNSQGRLAISFHGLPSKQVNSLM